MKQTFIAAAAFLAICAVHTSCKKKNNTAPMVIDSVIYPDFFVMKQGNYWIYQQYEVTDTSSVALNVFDSCYYGNDTIIRGNTYHTWYAPGQPNAGNNAYAIQLIRDSLGYVVNAGGTVIFAYADFTDTFTKKTLLPDASHPDTILYTTQMGFQNAIVTVPAGTFTTSAFREIFHMPAGYTTFGATRDQDYFYAVNIGLIKSTAGFYNNLPQVYEWHLVQYHL